MALRSYIVIGIKLVTGNSCLFPAVDVVRPGLVEKELINTENGSFL